MPAIKVKRGAFPGGPGVKNPSAEAADMSLISGYIPQVVGNYPCATVKALAPKAQSLQQEKSLQREDQRPQLEKAHSQQ